MRSLDDLTFFGGPLQAPFPVSPIAPLAPDGLRAAYPTFADLEQHAATLGLRLHRRQPASVETPTNPLAFLPSELHADLALLDTIDDATIWDALVPSADDLMSLGPQARGLVQVQLVKDVLRLKRPNDVPVRLSNFLETQDPTALALAAHLLLRRRFSRLEPGLQNRLRARLLAHAPVQAMGLTPQSFEVFFVALMLHRADRIAALLAEIRQARAETTRAQLPDLLVSPIQAALPSRARGLYQTDIPVRGTLIDWRAPRLPETILVGGVRTTIAAMNENFSLNKAEQAFLHLIEDPALADTIRWWHRNPLRKSWSVGLRRLDQGGLHYPDFVVGLADGRRRLVETKEDVDTIASLRR